MLNAPLEGRRWVDVWPQRTAIDFAGVIRTLCDEIYPEAETIVLVMIDEYSYREAAGLGQGRPLERNVPIWAWARCLPARKPYCLPSSPTQQ